MHDKALIYFLLLLITSRIASSIAIDMAPKRKGARKAGVRNAGGTFTLDVIEGPLSGSVITRKGKTFRIGRTKASKLQIKDDTVSEKHGELVFRDSCWQIRDLGSSNGTAVNGVDLEDEYIVLRDGDRIRIGEVTVVVFRSISEEGKDVVGHGDKPEQEDDRGQSVNPDEEERSKKQKSTVEDERDKGADLAPVDETRTDTKVRMNTHSDDMTVLDYLEKECSSLEEEIMQKGMDFAEQLRQQWHSEKQKLVSII